MLVGNSEPADEPLDAGAEPNESVADEDSALGVTENLDAEAAGAVSNDKAGACCAAASLALEGINVTDGAADGNAAVDCGAN